MQERSTSRSRVGSRLQSSVALSGSMESLDTGFGVGADDSTLTNKYYK